MNIHQKRLFVLGEYLGPCILVITLITLFSLKVIDNIFILFWIGFGIASIWEWSHYIKPGFLKVNNYVNKNIPGPVYPILHSIHDAFIFICGFILCKLILGDNAFKDLNILYSLFILFIFFISIEILVELIFNGVIWRYRNKDDPPIIDIKGKKRDYIVNFWPFFEWVVATFIFLAFCVLVEHT